MGKKLPLFALLVGALFLMTACFDEPEPVKESLTKEDVKEAIQEATKPGQFTEDAWDAYEKNRDQVKAQYEGYSAEDEKRKEMEARKAYDERMEKKRGKDWKEKELREFEEDMERRYGKDWMKDERRQRQYEGIKEMLYGKDSE